MVMPIFPDEDSDFDEPDDDSEDMIPFEPVNPDSDEESADESTEDGLSPVVQALANAEPGEYIDYTDEYHGQKVMMPNRLRVAKRTKTERERDLILIAELYLKGYSHLQISDEIGKQRSYTIKRSQVSRDIEEIHHRWQKSYLTSMNELKVRELAKIDRLESTYWEGYERSTRDFVSVRQDKTADEIVAKTKAVDSDGNPIEASVLTPSFTRTKTTTRKEERVGSVAFLEGVERCIMMRIKVLGLEPSKSITINWRKQAEAEGINPEDAINGLVEQFLTAAATGMDGSGSSGSLG